MKCLALRSTIWKRALVIALYTLAPDRSRSAPAGDIHRLVDAFLGAAKREHKNCIAAELLRSQCIAMPVLIDRLSHCPENSAGAYGSRVLLALMDSAMTRPHLEALLRSADERRVADAREIQRLQGGPRGPSLLGLDLHIRNDSPSPLFTMPESVFAVKEELRNMASRGDPGMGRTALKICLVGLPYPAEFVVPLLLAHDESLIAETSSLLLQLSTESPPMRPRRSVTAADTESSVRDLIGEATRTCQKDWLRRLISLMRPNIAGPVLVNWCDAGRSAETLETAMVLKWVHRSDWRVLVVELSQRSNPRVAEEALLALQRLSAQDGGWPDSRIAEWAIARSAFNGAVDQAFYEALDMADCSDPFSKVLLTGDGGMVTMEAIAGGARRLSELGPCAVPRLSVHLEDPRPEFRALAAMTIEAITGIPLQISVRPDSLESLTSVLRQWEEFSGQCALWWCKRPWLRDLEVVRGSRRAELLCLAFETEKGPVRNWLAREMGNVSDVHAVDCLLDAIPSADANLLRCIADSLGALRDARAVPSLVALLGNEESSVRCTAAHALGQLRHVSGIAPLFSAFADADGDVREAAARAVGQMGASVLPRLREQLKADDTNTRLSAIYALDAMGEAGIGSLIEALDDPYFLVRVRAEDALKRATDQNFGPDPAKWNEWMRTAKRAGGK